MFDEEVKQIIYPASSWLQVLGRHVRDFVNGLDNLHEYLRFSYPKVQPPTFFCQEESATGVTLHYRCEDKALEKEHREIFVFRNEAILINDLCSAGVSVKATCTMPWVSCGRWANSSTTLTSTWRCCLSRWSEIIPTSR